MKLQHELTFFFKHAYRWVCRNNRSLESKLATVWSLQMFSSGCDGSMLPGNESDGFMWRASKIWSRTCITLRTSIGAEKLNLRSSKEALVFRSHDRNMHSASFWGVGCAASASNVFPGTFKWCLASKKIQRILIFKTR